MPTLIPYRHCALWVIHEHAKKATMVAQAGRVKVQRSKSTMMDLSDCDTWQDGRDPTKFQFIRDPKPFPPDWRADERLRNKISVAILAPDGRLRAQIIVYPDDQSDAFSPDDQLFQVMRDHVSLCTRTTPTA